MHVIKFIDEYEIIALSGVKHVVKMSSEPRDYVMCLYIEEYVISLMA